MPALQVQEMYATALAEDPNAFEYDGVYESMQEQKAVPKQREKLARQPKYISSLLEQAELRKREQEITYERQLVSAAATAAAASCLACTSATPGPARLPTCQNAYRCCFLLLLLLQLKERQKEDHMYDGQEKFITSAYRRKLEEDKKWQESQRLK